jgi:hypothetical protein
MTRILAFTFSALTILLIIFGSYYIGLFDSNKLFVKEPPECTSPDLDVIFGRKKIASQMSDSLKKYDFDFSSLWITNKEDFFKVMEEEYEDYYTITFKFYGKKRESDSGAWNPLVKSDNWQRIDTLVILGYISLIFISFILSTIYLKRLVKPRNPVPF